MTARSAFSYAAYRVFSIDEGGLDMANPIPQGFNTITPHLTLKNAAETIEFYKKAFGG